MLKLPRQRVSVNHERGLCAEFQGSKIQSFLDSDSELLRFSGLEVHGFRELHKALEEERRARETHPFLASFVCVSTRFLLLSHMVRGKRPIRDLSSTLPSHTRGVPHPPLSLSAHTPEPEDTTTDRWRKRGGNEGQHGRYGRATRAVGEGVSAGGRASQAWAGGPRALRTRCRRACRSGRTGRRTS